MHDAELINEIKRGSESAFRLLIDRYKAHCFNIAFGIVQDKEIAEDVVQDVFLKFWEIKKDFELKAKFSTWMYRVATNMALNKIRKNKLMNAFSKFPRLDSSEDNDGYFDNKMYQQPEVETQKHNEYIKEALKIAIDSLPRRQKIAFVLNKYEKLSYREVADIMEVSLQTVESLLFRAKENLQKKLLQVYKNLD